MKIEVSGIAIALALGMGFGSGAVLAQSAAPDLVAGKKIFKKCAICHQIGPSAKNRIGPVLSGVIGRPAGTFKGYRYSKSMGAFAATGFVWSADAINEWLQSPTKFLRARLGDARAKSKMRFKLKKAQDRRNVIAYVASFSVPTAANEAAPAVTPALSTPTSTPTSASTSASTSTSASNGICVSNNAPQPHVFTVESASGTRKLQHLNPGQTLCVDSTGAGTVAVFLSETAVEGCTRITQANKPESLLHYYPFDRCLWQSSPK